MANKKISELTQTTSLTGEELVPIVSNGQNKAVKIKYLTEVPTKVSELENDKGYLTSIPSEYVTETELENKDYATETFVINKIAEAQLDGGEVNLDGLATKDDLNTKVDKVNGKGLSTNDYTTQEKNKLNGIENNANNYVHPEKHNVSMIDGLANVATSGNYNDLSNKPTIPSIQGLATEQYVDNAIANAQLGGGGEGGSVNLESYAKTDYVDNQIQEYTGGKKQRYVTQNQFDAMSEEEQNDEAMVWNITNKEERPIPTDLVLNDNMLTLQDEHGNNIGDGVYLEISNSNSGTTADSVVLTSPNGSLFKIIVDNSGQLSTEEYFGIQCDSITLNMSSATLIEGRSIQLDAIVTPIDCQYPVIWSTDSENCTVEEGIVTAITAGNYVVTAQCGKKSATCNIEVIEQPYEDDPTLVACYVARYHGDDNQTFQDLTGNNDDAIIVGSGATWGEDVLNMAGQAYLEFPFAPMENLTQNVAVEVEYTNITTTEYVADCLLSCLEEDRWLGGMYFATASNQTNLEGTDIKINGVSYVLPHDVLTAESLKLRLEYIEGNGFIYVNDELVKQGKGNDVPSSKLLKIGKGKFGVKSVKYYKGLVSKAGTVSEE